MFKAYKAAKITPFNVPAIYEHRLHVRDLSDITQEISVIARV